MPKELWCGTMFDIRNGACGHNAITIGMRACVCWIFGNELRARLLDCTLRVSARVGDRNYRAAVASRRGRVV